jgi:hypothetical protein
METILVKNRDMKEDGHGGEVLVAGCLFYVRLSSYSNALPVMGFRHHARRSLRALSARRPKSRMGDQDNQPLEGGCTSQAVSDSRAQSV